MKNQTQNFITSKPFIIAALVLLMLIPLSFIKDLVHDRQDYKNQAVKSISMPLGSAPKIEGLVIAMPYWEEIKNEKTVGGVKTIETTRIKRYLIVAPSQYDLDVQVSPYMLNRGIFKVPAFNAGAKLNAAFTSVDLKQFSLEERAFIKDECLLLLGMGNSKSLKSLPKIQVAGKTLSQSEVKFSGITPFASTLYYILPENFFNSNFTLNSNLELQGTKYIDIVPIAGENNFKMISSWATPGFSGSWLPNERTVTDYGFEALWNIPGLSTNFSHAWNASENSTLFAATYEYSGFDNRNYSSDSDGNMEVDSNCLRAQLVIPVDSYQKTTRSVKYGILFLMVPFIALFLCDLFLKKNVHPIQYCLIGVVDVLFYLLLLSISEHLSFFASYFISAAAVCFSTFFYTSGVFKDFKWAGLLSFIQLISYIFLFGTLQAEDYALLIGSIGLFVVVFILMWLTRKVDWYALQTKIAAEKGEEPENLAAAKEEKTEK